MEGGGKMAVVDSLFCRHDKHLCIFSGGRKKRRIIEMHQTQVLVVVTVRFPHAYRLKTVNMSPLFRNSWAFRI